MKNFNEALKTFKVTGIIVSIVLVILGVIIVSAPVKMGVVSAWCIISALLANGIYRIIRYFGFPKEKRNGWMLADGVISTLIGLVFFFNTAVTPIKTTVEFVAIIGFIVGFYEIIIGINQLCSIGVAKAAGRSTGWLIFIGIVNVLCGIFVVSHPVISYLTIELIMGIYLCIFGITTFIECICLKTKKGE